MKKVYLAVAATLLFGAICSASSISPKLGCPGQSCPFEPVQTVSSTNLLSSANLTSLASPSTTNLTPTLTTASNLLSQSTAMAPAPANSSLGINPVVPDLKIEPATNASSVSEPSTLLLLAAGLLFVPFIRKSRLAKRDLRELLA